jgi:hypothetical protein
MAPEPSSLLQAAFALLGGLLTISACYATGTILIDRLGLGLRRLESLPLAFMVGAACLHLVIFTLLDLNIAYWPALAAVVAGPIAAGIACRLRTAPEPGSARTLRLLCQVLFVPFFIFYLFHAWAPENSPDGSSYHLGNVALYLRDHGFKRVAPDMFTSLSQGMELIFLPAFAIGKHSAAAIVHLGFAVALAVAMFAFGKRIGNPWVGACASFLVFASPVVGIAASSAYNDVGLAATGFGCFYLLELWNETDNSRLLALAGVLAGYAYAIKYSGGVAVPFAVGFVALKSKRLRPVAVVILFASLMMAPWMIKNWITVQNPLAPLANTIFRNPYFHPYAEAQLALATRWYDVTNRMTLPLEVAVRGAKTQGMLGPLFLLAPIGIVAARSPVGRTLLAAAVVFALPYYFNFGTRFLIPALPYVALAMAVAMGNFRGILSGTMAVHAVLSWPWWLTWYCDQYAWRLETMPWKAALRIIPEDQYLRDHSWAYSAARLIDANVPKGSQVLGTGGVAFAYSEREFLIDTQSAPSQTSMDALNVAWNQDYQPSMVQVFRMDDRNLRRLRLVQIATVASEWVQWGVHEIRFYHRGNEVKRNAAWRLRAWPNPWEVQLAFDGSLATRWRTWEAARPGDYIEVDFGKDEEVDEVRVYTSPEDSAVQTALETLDQNGNWLQMVRNPHVESSDLAHYSLRLAATYEMKRRALEYLEVTDNFAGASDLADDPEAWGLTKVAAGYGLRLYRVNP